MSAKILAHTAVRYSFLLKYQGQEPVPAKKTPMGRQIATSGVGTASSYHLLLAIFKLLSFYYAKS